MPLTKKMTVLRRVLLWLIAISVVTFFVLVFIGWEIRQTIRENGLNRIQMILTDIHHTIDAYVDTRFTALDNADRLMYFASRHHPVFSDSFWTLSPKTLQDNLSDFVDKNGFYDLFVISVGGEVLYTVQKENDLHTNLLHGPYQDSELAHVFRDALAKQKPYVSDFMFYEPSHNYAAFIAKPIIDNGTVIGIIALQLENNEFQSAINHSEELGLTGEIIVTVVRDGKLITMAPVRNSDIKAFSELDTDDMNGFMIDQNQTSGQRYTNNRLGHPAAVAWDYNDKLRWTMTAAIEENELLREWYKQITSLFILFLTGVAVVLGMVVMAFRSFARPIQELTNYALQISKGNYSIEIDSNNYDQEWQVLIRIFKQMSIEIDQRMIQLNDQNRLLEAQKFEIEELNSHLQDKIRYTSKQLNEYISVIDKHVITSQTDIRGIITNASEAFCHISGYSKEELIGKSHRIVRHPDMPDELFADLWKTISAGEIWRGEIKNLKSDGDYYWVDTAISPMFENGKIIGYTAVRHNITHQKKAEELAITDAMTGLYNRRFYNTIIHNEINRAKRNGYSFALMMVDVDNFKQYNDRYGHQAGDDVLINVAKVLMQFTSRNGEYAFRLGGEEFGLLFSNMSKEEYWNIGDTIRRKVQELAIPHDRNNAADVVTISMGITASFSDSKISSDIVYREADKQLYLAKEQGRNRVVMSIEG